MLWSARSSVAKTAAAAAAGLLLVVAVPLGLGLPWAYGEPSAQPASSVALPGPAPRLRKNSLLSVRAENDACASCHADIAEEWRGSLHQRAWSDPVFQKAYAIEPVAFCRSCHAPEADPKTEPAEAAQAVGVGCTTCHVQGQDIVGSRQNKGAPHPVFADARLSTTQACASCHQFNFPGETAPMQDTVREHAASSFAKTDCQGCHMPQITPEQAPGKPHKSHAFKVVGDAAILKQGAKISASRPSAKKVLLTLAPYAAGHSFPTGDMFRRLEVRADALDVSGKVIATAEPVFLGRTFADRPRDREAGFSFHRTEAADSRVPPPGAGSAISVELTFSEQVGAARIRYQVAYQRMNNAMAASFGVSQAMDEVVIAEGILPSSDGK